MQLRDDYENPLEKAMADLAFLVSVQDENYESPFDALFALLCRGTAVYVQAWAENSESGDLASMFGDQLDLEDPSRAGDLHADARLKLELTLTEAIDFNVRSILFGDKV